VVLAVFAGAPHNASAQGAGTVTLTHVHGLAYSTDGRKIYIPSHHGLAIYSGGKWSKAPGPQHDYMGFSATKDGFYSSGHPAPGSGLINPFGVIRSTDAGKTWTKLGLEGETDFHVLATSWDTNAVYVYNPAPNSRMKTAGIYYTLNNGFMWKRAGASGFDGAPASLAVHPGDPKVVVAAAKTGFYLSTDSGENFRAISEGAQGLAAFFDLDGEHLWLSSYAGTPSLARTHLKTGKKDSVPLPPLTRDAVAYIAQNPVDRNEYAIATFERSVFTTQDGGKTWRQIAREGKGL
jgi:DNA-binding beta-propeller fold protein YncE